MSYRSFFTFVFFLISTGFAVFIFNRNVDPSGIHTYHEVYRLSQEQTQADIFSSGLQFDQRAWVKARLDDVKNCPEILLLGTSTVGQFTQEMFGEKSFLNAWQSGANVQDYEAIVSLLRAQKCTPGLIILGTDPWIFNPFLKSDRWTSLMADYLAYQPRQDIFFKASHWFYQIWGAMKEDLNYQTTRESVLTLLHKKNDTSLRPKLTRETVSEYCERVKIGERVRAYDGHFFICKQFHEPQKHADEVAAQYLNSDAHELKKWKGIDNDLWDRFNHVVQALTQNGKSQVILMRLPYHPITDSIVKHHPEISKIISNLDEKLQKISLFNHGIKFLNFSDSAAAGCTNIDFQDDIHFDQRCAAAIVKKIKAQQFF